MLVDDIKKINNINDLKKIINYVDRIDIMDNEEQHYINERIFFKNFIYSQILLQKKEIIASNKEKKINLKRFLRKKLVKRTELAKIYYLYPDLDRNLGNLPSMFLDNISNKKECSSKTFELFAKYSFILNVDIPRADNNSFQIYTQMNNLKNELSKIINKPVNIEYVGRGCNGNGFKISVTNKNYTKDFFYKVFFPTNFLMSRTNTKHGKEIEPAYAYFACQNSRKNQFSKFYMGRITSPLEKDAFILTDFIERNPSYVPNNNILTLDYIKSDDMRLDNTINGITVDFGGLIENIPELRDKKLRKLVRVILLHITRSVDELNIKYTWKIKVKNIESLTSFLANYDQATFYKALKIIKKTIPTLPPAIITNLKKIKKGNQKKEVNIVKFIQKDDLITNSIKTLKKNIKYLNLKIKSSLDGSKDMFGYVMLDLFYNRQAVYILDKDNNITKIRIEKKVNNQFNVLLELKDNEINEYDNPDIISVICG